MAIVERKLREMEIEYVERRDAPKRHRIGGLALNLISSLSLSLQISLCFVWRSRVRVLLSLVRFTLLSCLQNFSLAENYGQQS
ncbi:hypothetical protein LWI28_010802 [Acer negundo]|uniref:Uncharacterized protein n=1 Tax=Acer negundo TaxID=4023 RepID=A0AAD5NKQ4_ACENE|nr:hypothetical protein LWI28_010802 [Acer negundo]